VNTIDGPTKLVRQDAILGGLSIGQIEKKLDCGPTRSVNKVSQSDSFVLGTWSGHQRHTDDVLISPLSSGTFFVSHNNLCKMLNSS